MSPGKTEDEFIEEMKESIKDNSQLISKKVIRSALVYMNKKGWLNSGNISEIETFFVGKIPQVLSDELSKKLNQVLGLDLKL